MGAGPAPFRPVGATGDLGHIRAHLESLDTQIAALDAELDTPPASRGVSRSRGCGFRGIVTHTAIGLLAEIGDFCRFQAPGS